MRRWPTPRAPMGSASTAMHSSRPSNRRWSIRSEEAGLKARPEADNLVGIYAALADTTRANVLGQYGNAQFSTFKSALVDLSAAKLGPIAGEMKRLLRDPVTIDAILADG